MERSLVTDRFLGSQIVMMIMLQIPGFLRSVCHTSSRVFLPDLQAMNNALRFGTWRLPNLPRSITALLYQPTAQTTTPMYTQPQVVMSQQRPAASFYASPPQTVQQNNPPPALTRGEQIRNYAFNSAWLFCPALKSVITQARTVTGGDVPKTDDNTEFYMSFQFKGKCRSNCQGPVTHRAPSAAEYAQLNDWHRIFCMTILAYQPGPAHQPASPTSYTQPMLPRDPQPGCGGQNTSRVFGGRDARGGRGNIASPTPTAALPPVVEVIASTNTRDCASTIGNTTHN